GELSGHGGGAPLLGQHRRRRLRRTRNKAGPADEVLKNARQTASIHRVSSQNNSALPHKVSDIFDPTRWRVVEGFDFTDITYHRQVQRDASGAILRDLPTVRIAFGRPEVRHARPPHTAHALYGDRDHARMT